MPNTEEQAQEVQEQEAQKEQVQEQTQEPTPEEASVQPPQTKENKRKPKEKVADASSRQSEGKPIGHSGKLRYFNS